MSAVDLHKLFVGDWVVYANGQEDSVVSIHKLDSFDVSDLDTYLVKCLRTLCPCFVFYRDGKLSVDRKQLKQEGWDIVATVTDEEMRPRGSTGII